MRFTASNPCPICNGHDHLPRGAGIRCWGFLTPDGRYAHCSREETAGTLPLDGAQTYGHFLAGLCSCGADHRLGVLSWQPIAHEPHARTRTYRDIPLWKDPAWHRVATYDYRHADGRVSYQVERWERKDGTAKTFKQRRYDALLASGWRSGLAGVERLPYRLPELTRADHQRVVFIPEGEKQVDALCRLGFLASTNSEGAHKGSWRPELARHFEGRHVVILPDNDDDGRRHGQEVAEALQDVAVRVRWLELPGLAVKGDICDWLDAGGTPEQLLALARAAPRWCASAISVSPRGQHAEPPQQRYGRANNPLVMQYADPRAALAALQREGQWWST